MRVLSLDLSLTAAGWAKNEQVLATPGLYATGTLRSSASGVRRLQDLLNKVILLARGIELVVIEGYSFASVHQAHQLGELGGVIRLGLSQLQIPVVEIAPSVLKKFATGVGNAKKESVLAEAIRRLGFEGSDHNQADALWLLQIALTHYQLPGAVHLPKAQIEALGKVEWPPVTSPEPARR